MKYSDWRPPNLRFYRVDKRWLGWTLYRGGAVWSLEEPYSHHLSEKRAKKLGEQWVAEGNP